MNKHDHSHSISLVVRLIRSILALYPAEFRAAYEQDMLLTFQTRCFELRSNGDSTGLICFFLTTGFDVLGQAAREQMESVVRSPVRGRLIGSLAWMLGGLLWALLHTPIANTWLAIPVPALILLIIGLVGISTFKPSRLTSAALLITGLGLTNYLLGYLAAQMNHIDAARVLTITGIILEVGGIFVLAYSLFFKATQPQAWQSSLLLHSIVSLIDAVWQLMPLAARDVLYSPIYPVGVAILGVMVGIGWMVTGALRWRSATRRTVVIVG